MKLHLTDPKTVDLTRYWGTQNALLTAGDKTGCNTMTIGWGQNGLVWGLPVCTVYVRPERYTYEFMESHDYFTLSILPESEKKAMALCGTKSGRDTDKIAACGLTLAYGAGDAPYFEQAELVLVCRKLYYQDIDPAHFLDQGIDGKWYPQKDYHRMYIGEIVEAYQKK